jgi:hypothetical protein
MLALSLIICGILLRLAPHPANFTPVAAIALFSGAYLNKRKALFVPLLLMITSDLIIGLHNVVIFTWGSFALITLLGPWIKKYKTIPGTASMSLLSSILFYIITNFGVWVMGWYPLTLKGLAACYIMGLPFLRNFTLATFLYTAVFFGIYELTARLVKDTKLSKVLLTVK